MRASRYSKIPEVDAIQTLPSTKYAKAAGMAEAGRERGEKRLPSKLVMRSPERTKSEPSLAAAREATPPEGNPSVVE
jgi:hypothetical protein